jgi:DNA-binding CsgD family transcriptional regulator
MSNQIEETKEKNKNITALTSREAQCVGQILEGKSRLEIAKNLNITENTVNFCLTNARLKLGIPTGNFTMQLT